MRAPILFASLLLAACADHGPAPLPVERVSAGFPPHGIADTIVVAATDRLPLRAAALVAPDGGATPASFVEVDPAPSYRTSQKLGNDPYAGDVFGVGNVGGAALLPVPAGGAAQTDTELLVMASRADIPLPDPVAYRKGWAGYHIRLTFGTPPAPLETRDIPAPPPPE